MRIYGLMNCARCNKPILGSIDIVYGCQRMVVAEDGTFDFIGTIEMFWDEQRNVSDSPTKLWVQCVNGHEWVVEID